MILFHEANRDILFKVGGIFANKARQGKHLRGPTDGAAEMSRYENGCQPRVHKEQCGLCTVACEDGWTDLLSEVASLPFSFITLLLDGGQFLKERNFSL